MREDDEEEALTGPCGRELMELIRALSLWEPLPVRSEAAARVARSLGWLDDAGALTDLGWRVASPLREFLYWEERQRALHPAFAALGWLDPQRFEGKEVLELGCGFGCNLFTLSPRCLRITGVDVDPLVLEYSRILARIAGLPPPRVLLGNAEALPLADESQDIVVAFGSIQYMDIRAAIREAARTLRPGGWVLVTTSTLGQFLCSTALMGAKLLRPRIAYWKLRSLGATLSYQFAGRRIGARPDEEVWPSAGFAARWFRRAGLRVAEVRNAPSREICYVAEKPS